MNIHKALRSQCKDKYRTSTSYKFWNKNHGISFDSVQTNTTYLFLWKYDVIQSSNITTHDIFLSNSFEIDLKTLQSHFP